MYSIIPEFYFLLQCRSNLHTGIVLPSFGGSRPKPSTVGGAIVDLNKTPSQGNLTQVSGYVS